MRIYFHSALVIASLFLPWWVFAPIMVFACFSIAGFYEVVLYGIAIDVLYASSHGFHGFAFFWSAFSIAILALAAFLRSRLSW